MHIAHDTWPNATTPNTHSFSLALIHHLPPKCDLVSRPASFMLFPPQMMCLMLLLLCTTAPYMPCVQYSQWHCTQYQGCNVAGLYNLCQGNPFYFFTIFNFTFLWFILDQWVNNMMMMNNRLMVHDLRTAFQLRWDLSMFCASLYTKHYLNET